MKISGLKKKGQIQEPRAAGQYGQKGEIDFKEMKSLALDLPKLQMINK